MAMEGEQQRVIKQLAEQHTQLRSLHKEISHKRKKLHVLGVRVKNLEILDQRDEAQIQQTRQDIQTTTDEMAKMQSRCRELEEDISRNTIMQLRYPGAVHASD